MEDSRNMFALFEHNNTRDKAVESRVLVADVLAKFERWVIIVLVTSHIDRQIQRFYCTFPFLWHFTKLISFLHYKLYYCSSKTQLTCRICICVMNYIDM